MSNRGMLDQFRSSAGVGQLNIRNANTRSNDQMAYNAFPSPNVPSAPNAGTQAGPSDVGTKPMQYTDNQMGGGGFNNPENTAPSFGAFGGNHGAPGGGPTMPMFNANRPMGQRPDNNYNMAAQRLGGATAMAGNRFAPTSNLFANRQRRVPFNVGGLPPPTGGTKPPPIFTGPPQGGGGNIDPYEDGGGKGSYKAEDGNIGLPPYPGY
jgi:hypothetical protein